MNRTKCGAMKDYIILCKLTAGEDQVPQERANVTRGSDSSSPYMLLAVIS